MNSSKPKTDYLFACCRNVAHETGVPAQLIFAHALLFATALLGDKACYRRMIPQAPQIIASPVTVITLDQQCPTWLLSVFSRTIGHQQSMTKRAQDSFNLLPRPRDIKRAKNLIRMYAPIRELLPNDLEFAADTGVIRSTPEIYVCLGRSREEAVTTASSERAFSPRLLALSVGVDSYKNIITGPSRWRSPERTAVETLASSRTTRQGWGQLLPMRKLLRKVGFAGLPPLGWLLEYPEETAAPDFSENVPQPYLRFFDQLFSLRLGPPVTFLPDPAVIEMLDAAVAAQGQRTGPSGVPSEVVNPEPMLPWQIATVFWSIERCHDNPNPENKLLLADRACQIARLIHELHISTLGGIFPMVTDGEADPISALILDKLAVAPLQPRELARKFHRVTAQELKWRLEFLAENGKIERNGEGKWSMRDFSRLNFSRFGEICVSKKGREA
ncbi:hypothetical protein JIN84_21545 [Luteolibacter yonseiensis]|uniref:DUF3987 domain-containing protein n=1 Tax=Luteolibacter yonseiensis TaxID=1144680 RepID=A0A934R4F6_9BACT|nr:hypothetical protein [Luteolibacter yonseiensis]MBK1818223.1 hypothetical protein [Luteolibacter yonseiensis]